MRAQKISMRTYRRHDILFWEHLPSQARVNEEQARTHWLQKSCVALLRAFKEELARSSLSAIAAEFEKLCPLADLMPPEAERARAAFGMVDDTRVAEFGKYVERGWQMFWNSLPVLARVHEEDMHKSWLHTNCVPLLEEFGHIAKKSVGADKTATLEQLLPFADFAPEVAETARAALSRIGNTRAGELERHVEHAWQSFWESLPMLARINEVDMRRNWLASEIPQILNEFENSVETAWEFIPTVAVASVPVGPKQTHAQQLVSLVRQEHVAMIDERVQAAFDSFWASLPSQVSPEMSGAIKDNWLLSEYYQIVEAVVNDKPVLHPKLDPKLIPAPASGSSSASAPLHGAAGGVPDEVSLMMLASPKKRKVGAAAATRAFQEPEHVTVATVHLGSCAPGDNRVCEAFLLHFPEEARIVQVTNRQTKQMESAAVATCLLGDRDGSLTLELWRDVATTNLRAFHSWSAASTGPVLVQVKYFTVKQDARIAALTPTRKASGSERTEIIQIHRGTQDTVLLMGLQPPKEALFTRNLSQLQHAAPYTVNVCAIVARVQAEAVSQNGLPMRAFELRDQAGRWVQCTAAGRHVDNPHLLEGKEVVVYGLTTSVPLSASSAPMCWLFDSSHIVCLRSQCVCPGASTQVLPGTHVS